MKVRKQVRLLHRALMNEVYGFARDNHACRDFEDNSTNCALCSLQESGKVFAMIQLLRERGFHPEWFHAERSLFDLLGEKVFTNKVELEIKEVSNFPRKICTCGAIVRIYEKFSRIARGVKANGYLDVGCRNCRERVRFMSGEFPDLAPYNGRQPNEDNVNHPPRIGRAGRGVPARGLGVEEMVEQQMEEAERQGEQLIVGRRQLLQNINIEQAAERLVMDRLVDPDIMPPPR